MIKLKPNPSRVLPWIIWGLSAAFVLFQFLLQSSVSVMIPELMRDLKINILDVGVLSSSFFYPYVLLQIPAGILVDRFGARILLTISILVCGLATLIFAISHDMAMAGFCRILMGMASAPSVVCGMYLACRWFDKEKFALIAGMIEMIGILGGAIGQVFLGYLVTIMGWRNALFFCAAIAFIMLLLCVIFVHNHSPYKPKAVCEKIQIGTLLKKFAEVINIPQVWVSCIYSGLMFSIITGFAGLWSIPFLQACYDISANRAAEASALIFVGAAIGTGFIGWLACVMGKLKIIMTTAALLSFITMIAIVFITMPIGLMWLALLFIGFCSGSYVLAFAIVKKNTCQEVNATAMGFTNMVCIILGAPVLQPLIGWLLNRFAATKPGINTEDFRLAMAPIIIFLLLAFLVGLLIKDKECEPE